MTKDALDMIVHLLTNDPYVKELCSIDLSRTGVERFHANFRRLLKKYCLDLREEAHTELEKDAVRVVRSRSSRLYIAEEVVKKITIQETNTTDCSIDLRKERLAVHLLQDWDGNLGSPLAQSLFDSIIQLYIKRASEILLLTTSQR